MPRKIHLRGFTGGNWDSLPTKVSSQEEDALSQAVYNIIQNLNE